MTSLDSASKDWGDREVVITGVGMVTPIGVSTMETWRALCVGDNGIGPITRFDASTFPVRFAAECREIEIIGHEGLSPTGKRILSTQKGKLAFTAAQEAWVMACVDDETSRSWTEDNRLGVCLGSEAGRPDLATVATQIKDSILPSAQDLEMLAPMAPATLVSEMLGATGPVSVVSTACTSSSQQSVKAYTDSQRRSGRDDGWWCRCPDRSIMVTGFSLLGALSTRNERLKRPLDLSIKIEMDLCWERVLACCSWSLWNLLVREVQSSWGIFEVSGVAAMPIELPILHRMVEGLHSRCWMR